MLVHMVADYGHGDLAFARVAQRVRLRLPDAETVPMPPLATLAAGFCVARPGLNPAPPGTVVYHNVAPREGNEGERLACALLLNRLQAVGENVGHTFSFVRDAAEIAHEFAHGLTRKVYGLEREPAAETAGRT